MNSGEKVIGAFNRTGFDRNLFKHEGTPEVNKMIINHFVLTNMQFEGGWYLESCCLPFSIITLIEESDKSKFPTAAWFDYSQLKNNKNP